MGNASGAAPGAALETARDRFTRDLLAIARSLPAVNRQLRSD